MKILTPVKRKERRTPPSPLIDLEPLQRKLADVDLHAAISSLAKCGIHPYMLYKRGHLKVRIYKEANHQRPHFHIEYKKEFAASHAIDTLQRLAGKMPPRYEKPIIAWAASNQKTLANIWRKLQSYQNIWETEIPEALG